MQRAFRQLLWFALLWAGGVSVVAVFGYALRYLLRA